MKAFIESNFKILDINSDGIVGLEEYRYNCITRMAIDDVTVIDKAFDSLLNVSVIYYLQTLKKMLKNKQMKINRNSFENNFHLNTYRMKIEKLAA